MTKRIAKIKRSVLRNIFAAFSFTTALFVFQACYGTPQGLEDALFIEGTVTSAKTGEPIDNIQIVVDKTYSIYTGPSDDFEFSTGSIGDQVSLSFQDNDGTMNGSYATKDTVIARPQDTACVYVDIILDEI